MILAPYGLAGVLTGRALSPTEHNLADWVQFYPLTNPAPVDSDLPAMVEVAVGRCLRLLSACSIFRLLCQKWLVYVF